MIIVRGSDQALRRFSPPNGRFQREQLWFFQSDKPVGLDSTDFPQRSTEWPWRTTDRPESSGDQDVDGTLEGSKFTIISKCTPTPAIWISAMMPAWIGRFPNCNTRLAPYSTHGLPRLRNALRITRRLSTQWVALGLLLFMVGCGRPSVSTPEIPISGEWRTFQGTWSASGTRQTLALETNHHTSIFDLTGSLLLTGHQGLGVGFQAQAIGFTDSFTGMEGWCVWTDEHGEKIYSQLKGEFVATGEHISGTIRGGTGRYTGITGEYSFEWRFIVESEDGSVSGRAVDLTGRARLGTAAAARTGERTR